jgi:hypothetical protein
MGRVNRKRAGEDQAEEMVRCGECRYWIGAGCHRYAPRPVVHKFDPETGGEPIGAYVIEVVWPGTSSEDYCGDGRK